MHAADSLEMLPIAVLPTATLPIAAPEAGGSAGSLGRGNRIGIAVDLQPGDAQPGNAVPLDCLLPRHEFLDREVVAPADLLQFDGPAAHGLDNNCLAPRHPSFGV